jgi:hypothetical protein
VNLQPIRAQAFTDDKRRIGSAWILWPRSVLTLGSRNLPEADLHLPIDPRWLGLASQKEVSQTLAFLYYVRAARGEAPALLVAGTGSTWGAGSLNLVLDGRTMTAPFHIELKDGAEADLEVVRRSRKHRDRSIHLRFGSRETGWHEPTYDPDRRETEEFLLDWLDSSRRGGQLAWPKVIRATHAVHRSTPQGQLASAVAESLDIGVTATAINSAWGNAMVALEKRLQETPEIARYLSITGLIVGDRDTPGRAPASELQIRRVVSCLPVVL